MRKRRLAQEKELEQLQAQQLWSTLVASTTYIQLLIPSLQDALSASLQRESMLKSVIKIQGFIRSKPWFMRFKRKGLNKAVEVMSANMLENLLGDRESLLVKVSLQKTCNKEADIVTYICASGDSDSALVG